MRLVTTVKPEELEPQGLTREKTRKEVEALSKSYLKCITLDSLYKRATNTEQKKDHKVALDSFYQHIYNEDKAYRPPLERRRKIPRGHYITRASYLLNECKKNGGMVSEIYGYKTARTLKEANPEPRQLSIETSTLRSLRRETIHKYQKLEYNLED